MKSIFVSFVYEDKRYLDSIKSWQLGNVFISSETQDLRPQGYQAIKNHIRNKIEGASLVLVLIGDTTHNHDWIRAEVELANSFHKKIICMRIPNTRGAKPPILNNYTEIGFNSNQLINYI